MYNKGIFFSISYMPMLDIFDCAQKKKKKKKRKKEAKRNNMLLHDYKCVF